MSDTWYSDDDDDDRYNDACDLLVCNTCIPRKRASPNSFYKLKVIVIYSTPWTSQPGAGSNPDLPVINGPPGNSQISVTAGLPWRVRLAATPTTLGKPVERRLDPALSTKIPRGWNKVYNVPNIVFLKYGAALKHATAFDFDFGSRNRDKEGVGKLMAYGGKTGNVQASVTFSYNWSRRDRHHHHDGHEEVPDVETDGVSVSVGDTGDSGESGESDIYDDLPVFEIESCTTQNAKFIVLSNFIDFIPENEDECFIPVVVLGIQQWCCERCDDCVEDAGGQYAPSSCKKVGLDCMALTKFRSSCNL